jgi:putative Mg2+ transporter-C (MgtC) family protein
LAVVTEFTLTLFTSPTLAWFAEQLEPLARLMLAGALGGVLGAERTIRQRAAGLRTNILIALGSALFTIISIEMTEASGGDPTRIPSQIVTGIGFLGGGAILREQGDIRGLTTAATVWVNAAIGMAAGSGHYALAITSTLVALMVLTTFLRIEAMLTKRSTGGLEPASDVIIHPSDADKNL